MKIPNWITGIVTNENPGNDIIAYHFGLFEGEKGYTLYLTGSSIYDEEDPDWTCNNDFEPREKYLVLDDCNEMNWKDVLEKVKTELVQVLKTEPLKNSFINKASGLTVGFDDGDLVSLK